MKPAHKATPFLAGLALALICVAAIGATNLLENLTLTSDADADGHQINNLATATNSTQAATLGVVTNQIGLASTNYATAAQGALADSSLQPSWTGSTNITTLGTITTGAIPWANLTNTPTDLTGYGITNAATAAQGALADTAAQILFTTAPATPTATGTTGTLILSGNHLYICVATDTWRRIELLTW
jgi:hypothetical protein